MTTKLTTEQVEEIRDDAYIGNFTSAATVCALAAKLLALLKALAGIHWKSADRDNMEFTARITCWQMDEIRALTTPKEPS